MQFSGCIEDEGAIEDLTGPFCYAMVKPRKVLSRSAET